MPGLGAALTAVLTGARRVKVLATSQERVRVASEREYAVPPLAMPDHGLPSERDAAALARVAAVPAMAVLLERTAAVRPGFALDAANLHHLVAICRQLEGLPLALEVAAARLTQFEPGELAVRLHNRHLLLDAQLAPAGRHRSLRAAIAWSHDLLGEPERRVFRRVAVFPADWSLAGAEHVVADPDLDVVTSVASLLDKSLVRRVDGADGREVFDAARQPAPVRAREAGRRRGGGRGRAALPGVLALVATTSEAGMGTPDETFAVRWDADEMIDLRARPWSRGLPPATWPARCRSRRSPAGTGTPTAASRRAGWSPTWSPGCWPAPFPTTSPTRWAAPSWSPASSTGPAESSTPRRPCSAGRWRWPRPGASYAAPRSPTRSSATWPAPPGTWTWPRPSTPSPRRRSGPSATGSVRRGRATTSHSSRWAAAAPTRQPDCSRTPCRSSRPSRTPGRWRGWARAGPRGPLRRHEWARAGPLLVDALDVFVANGDQPRTEHCVALLAELASARGLDGQAERLEAGLRRPASLPALARSVAEAAAAPESPLTPRQREVAALVARGATNRQIARSLGITDKTVEVHLTQIMHRLGAQNRAQVAAHAAHAGLD